MKEMLGARQDPHLRRRIHAPGPGVHRFVIDEFVRVALGHEPGTARDRQRREIESPHRRRHGHERCGIAQRCKAVSDEAAERESERPQSRRTQRPLRPVRDRRRILALADAIVVRAGASADSAKIESSRTDTLILRRTRERVHHLVLHRPAVQRVRMAAHGDDVRACASGGLSSSASIAPAGPSMTTFSTLGAGDVMRRHARCGRGGPPERANVSSR